MVHGHVIRAVKTETTYYRLALFFIKEVFLILQPQLEQKGLKAKVDMVQEET